VNDTPQTVRVSLGERAYDIEIGRGNLRRAGQFLTARQPITHAIIITDERVEDPHARIVAQSLSEATDGVDVIVKNILPMVEALVGTVSAQRS
jgi:3-dehydroquinate synthetase